MADAFTQEDADRLFSDEALAPSAPIPSGGPIETEDQADALFSEAALAPPGSSALGAAARSAELGVIPALTGIPAAGAGAEAGAALGSMLGPAGTLVGGIVGGLGGMFLGAEAGAAAQDYALSKMPDDAKKRFGLDEEQRLVDAAQHPYASQLGGLIPYVVTSSPFSPKAIEREMTALERFMQKPVVQRGIGGGMMGAWELGQEALSDEVDWTKVAVATAFGVIFNHQNRVGQYLHNIGARPVQRITGRLPDEPPPPDDPARSMGGALFSPRNMPDPRNPTLREVDAAGVMGPGNDEYTYMGLKRRPALEELFSHKRLEEEYDSLYGPQLPTPEQIASTARKIEPELFAARDVLEDQRRSLETAINLYKKPPIEEYDGLRSQRQALEDQLAETRNKGEQRRIRAQIRDLTGQIDDTWSRMQGEGSLDETLTGLFRELADVNAQIRAQGKDVAAANRRAADAIGAGEMVLEQPFVEGPASAQASPGIAPEMFTPARGSRPVDVSSEPSAQEATAAIAPARPEVDIEAEKARIIEASKREHMNAGVSADQAEEYAKLDAARYVTRAAWFKGALGTPFELYVSRHAKISLWEPGKRPPPATTPPVEPGPVSPDAVAATDAMRAAEARLAEAPPEASPASDGATAVPGRLPEAPAQEPVVEGEVSVAPAEPAEIAPSEPIPATAGPAAGDRIVLSGTPYQIESIDDQSVRLTPTRVKDKASALSLPRKAFDQMFAEHAAEAGVAQGEKITLNGEVLDAKLAEAVRKKLTEKEEAARGAPASERSAEEMALRQRMMDEALKSDDEFFSPQKGAQPERDGEVIPFKKNRLTTVDEISEFSTPKIEEQIAEVADLRNKAMSMYGEYIEAETAARAEFERTKAQANDNKSFNDDEWIDFLSERGRNAIRSMVRLRNKAAEIEANYKAEQIAQGLPDGYQAEVRVRKSDAGGKRWQELTGGESEAYVDVISRDGADVGSFNAVRSIKSTSGKSWLADLLRSGQSKSIDEILAEHPSLQAMPAHQVSTAKGMVVEVMPKIVEASSLIASSNPEYLAELQPRDRSRAASRQQIAEIARTLNPERLGMSAEADRGAPIVGSDNMVESGNGRVLALRQAYAERGIEAARYKKWLKDQGFDVSGFKEPVLVRERTTELTPEQRKQFTVEANQAATLQMSASERAMSDARLLDQNMLDLIVNADDIGAVKNRPFILSFVKKLPQTEQGGMTTAEGGLSAEGLARVRNAVLAKAYGDAALMARIAEATSDDIKSISNALTAGAPHWAKMRADVESGAVRADMDLTPELMEAVSRTADLRSKGVKLDQFLSQMDAFDRLNPQVEAWMRMFYNESGRRAASGQIIAERLRYFAEEARKVSADEGLSLDLPPVRPEDVQANAAQRGREQSTAQGQGNLFESSGSGVREGGAAGGPEAGRQIPGEGGEGFGGKGAGLDQSGRGDGSQSFDQRVGRGKEERALGKFIIRLNGLREIWFKPEANATTIIHEHGHEFLEQLREDAGHEAAPQQLRDDLETVKRWVGWGGKDSANKNGGFSTRQHEKFARGFERYLYDGVAPSKELAGVFQRFARWMREIYNAALGIKRPDAIPDEIRAVFDRLLAVEPHSVTIASEGGMRKTMADAHEAESRLATPESAGPLADRASAELRRTIAETPEEVRNELVAAAERAGAERAAADIRSGGERAGGMASDRGRSEAVSRREANGARGGAKPDGDRPSAPFGERAGGDGASGDDYFTRDGRFVDKAGNIRLENLTNAEDLRAAIREIAYGQDGFIEARRGKVPDEAVLSLAEEIGFEGAEELVNNWVVGQAFNAEEIMALRLLMRDSARDLHAKAKAVADGGDWQAVRDYALAKERHVSIQRTVSGATAEWGRAGRSFRDISGDVKGRALEKIVRESTAQTLFQLRDEANLLAGLDSEVAINRQTRHMASSYGEGLLEYATNNLISGPITHTVYTIANQTQAIYKALLETPARAVISQALRAAGKDIAPEEMVRFGEVWQQILGMGQGFAPGLKAAGQSLRVGLTTRLPRENMRNLPGIRPGQDVVEAPMVDMAYTLKEVVPDIFGALRGSVDAMAAYSKMLALGVEGEPFFRWKNNPLYKIPDVAIRGVTVPFGGVINSPSRLVSALHAFNRVQFYFMELNAEAFRRASAELERGQIAPQDFERRVAELKIHPDALMIDRASQAATESTQMAPGGAITQRLSRLVNSPIGGPNGPPLLRFIDPFIHISSNVLSGAFLKRTPLGFMSGPIRDDLLGRNGRVAQTNAMARMVMGTSVLASFGIMKASGYITGAAPDDPAEAATWRLAGYQPYSIKINGFWHPFHRLGVLGLLMGIGADLYDVSDHLSKAAGNYSKDDLKKMDEELMQAFGSLLHSISNNVMEESFMRGPAELMKAVEGGENAMSRYVRNFVSTMFTPFSVGMSQVARIADPVSRQARSLTDAILNKIPGMSKGLYPRRDIWGEPLMSQTSTTTSAPSRDPVNLEMYRLGVHKAPVERKIMGVELSEQQYDDYQRISGRMTKMQMDIMVRSPRWQSTPDPIKKMEMEKMIDAQRAAARNMMMLRYRSIPQDAFSAKRRARTEIQTNELP